MGDNGFISNHGSKRPADAVGALSAWAPVCSGNYEPMSSESSSSESSENLTQLLLQWSEGDDEALASLLPLVYSDLRNLASFHLSKERRNHTLQPTALVHEAWVKILDSDPSTARCKAHFFAAAAQSMRRILVDYARRRNSKKRAGDQRRITLELDQTPGSKESLDLLDVHRALNELSQVSERQSQVVELRYFGGLTIQEIAELLDISLSSVERDWRIARLWLRRRLESYEHAALNDED